MQIFISFASEQSKTAESIYRKLLAAGYDVFFSSDSIRAGEGYDERIRNAIVDADRVIFLASPDSLQDGCYTLTELQMISRKWEDPTGVVMPVLLEGATYGDLPAYLGAVTSAIEPQGSVESEVVATVIDVWPVASGGKHRRATNLLASILVVLLLVLGSWMLFASAGGLEAASFDIENGLYEPQVTPALDSLEMFCRAVLKKKRDWGTVHDFLDGKLRRVAEAEVLLALLESTDARVVPGAVEGHTLPSLPEEVWALLQTRGRDTVGLAERVLTWMQPHLQDGKRFFVSGMHALTARDTFLASVREHPAGVRRASLLAFLAVYETCRIFDMFAIRPAADDVTCWGYAPHLRAKRRAARLQIRLVQHGERWRVVAIETEMNPNPKPKPKTR